MGPSCGAIPRPNGCSADPQRLGGRAGSRPRTPRRPGGITQRGLSSLGRHGGGRGRRGPGGWANGSCFVELAGRPLRWQDEDAVLMCLRDATERRRSRRPAPPPARVPAEQEPEGENLPGDGHPGLHRGRHSGSRPGGQDHRFQPALRRDLGHRRRRRRKGRRRGEARRRARAVDGTHDLHGRTRGARGTRQRELRSPGVQGRPGRRAVAGPNWSRGS